MADLRLRMPRETPGPPGRLEEDAPRGGKIVAHAVQLQFFPAWLAGGRVPCGDVGSGP